jgi:hypothetical protein
MIRDGLKKRLYDEKNKKGGKWIKRWQVASPPGVCPSSRFVGEGDYITKNLMVTQRRKGFRQVRATESITPYVLFSGLY